MHEEMFLQIQEAINNNTPDDIVDAAPRGNAKSTLVSLALPIWSSVYKKKRYILLISDTSSQSSDFLGNIKSEFEENALLRDDFGDQVGKIVWTNSDIILRNDVRIQALGSGKKVRGRRYKQYRPDLIIGDDLENDENVASPDQRVKDHTWFTKALSKAGDERTDKIIIGTILHYDSLLAKLLKNPIYQTKKYQSVINWSASPLWDEWEKLITNLEDPGRVETAKAFFKEHSKEMLEGTKVLWPQKENYYSLMLQRIADGPAAFSSEKQNEPLSDDERRFQPEWIQYFEMEEIIGQNLHTVLMIDPSMGKKNLSADYSAIVVVALSPNGTIYVLAASIEKRHPDLITKDAIDLALRFDVKQIGIEQVAFQELYKDDFVKEMALQEISIPVKGVKQVSDKILRIQSLQPDIKNGRVKFRRDQQKLIDQLVNFPSADHDDGPDALEGAIGLLGRRSAVADYYKAQADEITQNNQGLQSFINNPALTRIGQ